MLRSALEHGVTAGVYAHARLRIQRHGIYTPGNALAAGDDSEEPPPASVAVR
ncbi:integrase [Streptomyces sp. DSM 118878]